MDPKPGQMLGSYRIEERLVSGGMAKVYRARQPSTNREVAIKVLPSTNADAATIARSSARCASSPACSIRMSSA